MSPVAHTSHGRVPDELVTVVGGGLAGAEAAWQLATRGVCVRLLEMRPHVMTPAHHTSDLGELVCSNSFKSKDPDSAAGLLKHELGSLGSVVLAVANETAIAAGAALAVDRARFSQCLTTRIAGHPRISLERVEATSIPSGPVIVATGPLTSPSLEGALEQLLGASHLAFFDAAAPIVAADSLDLELVFPASRYGKGEGADYLNAPLSQEQYETFIDALVEAERVRAKDFERRELFAACQPVEEIARGGRDSLRFGPLKPVGLEDPRTGRRPWAVVQLRSENAHRTAYNLVGFQTNLTFAEQRRVFRGIPGLEKAEFLRYGVMHRNTFVDAPRALDSTLLVKGSDRIRLAGQVAGTEGYLEAAASGLVAALNTYADIHGLAPAILPTTTGFGSLVAYATDPQTSPYQPMHVNFGLVPPLAQRVGGKRERYAAYSERARTDLGHWRDSRADLFCEAIESEAG